MDIEDINMGVPYWDSSLDWPLPTPKHSIFFSKFLVGEVDEDGLVKNGPYHNWTTIEVSPIKSCPILWNVFREDPKFCVNSTRWKRANC